MCEEDIKFALGKLSEQLKTLDDKVDKIKSDVDSLKSDRARLMGAGTMLWFCVIGVWFVFGDVVKTHLKRWFLM